LIESRSTGSYGYTRWLSKEPTLPHHFLIVGHGSKGLELPHILSDSGQEILPVFSSEEAAQEFLSLSSLRKSSLRKSSLRKGWYVRGFSGGELVSMLFAFHARIKGVLLDPQPAALSRDVAVSVVGRNAFIGSLLEGSSHHPGVGSSARYQRRISAPLTILDLAHPSRSSSTKEMKH
jgi:hypothetical protein